jgi:hypothetical protein
MLPLIASRTHCEGPDLLSNSGPQASRLVGLSVV